jgi:hypothetical protein
MPAPYTDTEQDTLIDQLLADYAALETRVTALETAQATLDPLFAAAQADIADLQTDSTTHGANITALQGDVAAAEANIISLDGRVQALEDATVPAVDTLQEDVAVLRVGAKDRQVNDTAQIKEGIVQRPSIERVKRPDGRLVQRVVKPR